MDKARAANMPSDNIQRIIKRATGEAGADSLEEVTCERVRPAVAVMISAMTDNRNRSASEIRHVFSKNGGNLGDRLCVHDSRRKAFLWQTLMKSAWTKRDLSTLQ